MAVTRQQPPPPYAPPPGMRWEFDWQPIIDFLVTGLGPIAGAHPEVFLDGMDTGWVNVNCFHLVPFVIKEEEF